MMKIILLAGAPGSGKSTQGAALTAMCPAIKHISLGVIVRAILENPEHPLTLKYKDIVSKGNLLPDDVIIEILTSELKKFTDPNTVVLLDGYPRTVLQYQTFKERWGLPAGLIHLDVSEDISCKRMKSRNEERSDDNDHAISKRFEFYRNTTKPLLEKIKQEMDKANVIVKTSDSIEATSIFLYAQLHRISSIHEVLNQVSKPIKPEHEINPKIKPIWAYSIFSQLWHTGNAYHTVDAIQKSYKTENFSLSVLGKKIVYLETAPEVRAVLEARANLGPVYRHFSLAANLKHEFVATDSHANTFRLDNNEVNIWKVIHNGFGAAIKDDRARIERLMNKHLDHTFFAEKTFDLDTTFDKFFCSFWSEYLFGPGMSPTSYMENRALLLASMKQCFYTNNYKGIDPTGLSSIFYSYSVDKDIKLAKDRIKIFINKSTSDSLVQRFRKAVESINNSEKLELTKDIIEEIVADNVFDLFFEPDFLENVMYEALVAAIQENADLHEGLVRSQVYSKGLERAYLFPVRSRILEESVKLPDGTELPAGTFIYVNLKRAGLYHSAGPRRCVGQAYTHYFKDHFFNRLESVEFKVKDVTRPQDREALSGNDNVPVSAERYQVSWRLKRDEAMRQLPFHNYKGNKFFDVLSLHEKPGLNALMVKQCTLKINSYLEKNAIDLRDVVIVSPEVRGIPIAAQVSNHLNLPLFIIRKKGGYKMVDTEVYSESYDKGYGDKDEVELPIRKSQSLAGKKIIFLDDGLASGKSALACIRLLEKSGVQGKEAPKVVMTVSLVKHDYVKPDPKLSEHCLVKTLFDCRSSASAPSLVTPTPTIAKAC